MAQCRVCKSEHLVFIMDMAGVDKKNVHLYLCKNCFAIMPEYEAENSSEKNEQEICDFFAGQEEKWDAVRDDLVKMVGYFSPYIDKGKPVAEIGGGPGCLAAAFLQEGYDYWGCEPTSLAEKATEHFHFQAERYAREPYAQFFPRFPLHHFGTIMIWHVLEHVNDPADLLWSAWRALEIGGNMLVQVPLLTPEYLFPQHLSFFTEETVWWLNSQWLAGAISKNHVEYASEYNFMTMIFTKGPK